MCLKNGRLCKLVFSICLAVIVALLLPACSSPKKGDDKKDNGNTPIELPIITPTD